MRDSVEQRSVANFSESPKKNLFPGLRYGIPSKRMEVALRFFGFRESEMDPRLIHFKKLLKKNTGRSARSFTRTPPMSARKNVRDTTEGDSGTC
jgi:hypothetical protein